MVAGKVLMVYPNALNSSLEHYIQPFTDWEVVVQYCYAVIFITTLTQSYVYWNRFGRNSQGLLKVSLFGLLATASMHIPLSFIAVESLPAPAWDDSLLLVSPAKRTRYILHLYGASPL
jgi:hypothetical protein